MLISTLDSCEFWFLVLMINNFAIYELNINLSLSSISCLLWIFLKLVIRDLEVECYESMTAIVLSC